MSLPRVILTLLLLLLFAVPPLPAQDLASETPSQHDARMEWWRDARFGMFIHWGLYAVPAGSYRGERVSGTGEWIMERARIPVAEYEQFARQFNPTQFDADAWVRLAKEAGMKYIIITSKHHEGFALFDSKVSSYDLVDASPYGRDALKQLAEAARRHGLKLGFYYSIMDWHHADAQAPHYPTYNTAEKSNPRFDRYVEEYMKPQLRLREIGDWMEVNGESIYGTSASPFPQQPAWGRFTRRDGTLYAHVFRWPEDGGLEITGLQRMPSRAYLLGDRSPLELQQTDGGVRVKLPKVPPSTIDAVLVLETR